MVHQFFEKVATRPELLNEAAVRLKSSVKGKSKCLKFSEIFAIFFPKSGKFGQNIESWIDVISSEFEFNELKVNLFWRCRLEKLFRKLGFSPRKPKNIHVFHFFLYLIYMYRLLIKDEYQRQDKIFAFFKGFPIEETKVVMFSHRPAKTADSFGFAFHRVKTACFLNMIPFLDEEFRMISEYLGAQELCLTERDLEKARETCNVKGWIEQGVLLLNMNLTPTNSEVYQHEIEQGWQIFTDVLISHLNREYENLVFLLLGSAVADKKRLINSERHMMMNFFHPSFYSHNEPPKEDPGTIYDLWERWLPFLNANFYLYQKCGRDSASLIDWNNMNGKKVGSTCRIKCIRYFFKRILKASKLEKEMEPYPCSYHRVSNDLVVFGKTMMRSYYTLKAWEIHEEMYEADVPKFSLKDFKPLHGHGRFYKNYY
ncbi:unnamed protein product [Orchesella dallaii]|uniref:Uncharacterized protein n=1 Tax=Orchesella dallaii TaxID=48710 RepID=A0ABP1QC83_9HEXA